MAATAFHDFPLAPRDRKWDGAAADKRVRAWAGAEDRPNGKYRDAHVWYDAGSKQRAGPSQLAGCRTKVNLSQLRQLTNAGWSGPC
jgi:hypothetical protein